jgi:hypothetical protein
MRKEIFNAILDLFFDTFPERKEIRYTVTESGELCRIFVQKGKDDRQDAGSSLGLLPDIELALLPDTALRREFQTTRLERSILTLVPDWAYNAEGATQAFVSWPCVKEIPKPICDSIRELKYELE